MKKLLSLLLLCTFLFTFIPAAVVKAVPQAHALEFSSTTGAYVSFPDIYIYPGNGSISFDISMEYENGDAPFMEYNGILFFSSEYVNLGSDGEYFNWGAVESNHFKHVTIEFADVISPFGDYCTRFYLDGELKCEGILTGGASSGFYLLVPRGRIFIDNFSVKSAGNEILFFDFEDPAVYNQNVSSDSSPVISAIPADSYYDYTEVPLPENIEYVFNSPNKAARLSVQSGIEMDRGDCNADGDITSRDSRLLKQVISGIDNIEYNEILTDVNADGDITAKDSRMLKQIIVGTVDPITAVIYSGSGGGTVEYDAIWDSALLTATDVTDSGIDAYLTMDPISAQDYKFAVISYMTPGRTNDKNSNVAESSAFGAGDDFVEYELTNDGLFHTQIVDISAVDSWRGDNAVLRFFTEAEAGDRIYIDSITFCAGLNKAYAAVYARNIAKEGYELTDETVPNYYGLIGEYDVNGNYLVVFDSAEKIASKVTSTHNTSVAFEDSSLKATATDATDPWYYIDLTDENISATKYGIIVCIYKNPTSNAGTKGGSLYFVCGDINVPTAGYETNVNFGRKCDEFEDQIYNLSASSKWKGKIKGLRIDYYTEAVAGDVYYLDSIIFATNNVNANRAIGRRISAANGIPVTNAEELWYFFSNYRKNTGGDEYVSGTDTAQMYFKYATVDTLTAESLGRRMARAISNATGYDVTCTADSDDAAALANNWSSITNQGYVTYTIDHPGGSYVLSVNTHIVRNYSYEEILDE